MKELYRNEEMILRIKMCKKEKKLSNEELSKLSGVPKGTLAKILGSETKDPQISNIIKISKALGVSADYIIFGKTETQSKSVFEKLFLTLNLNGQAKVIDYINDLINSGLYTSDDVSNDFLSTIKSTEKTYKIAARNGQFVEKPLSDSEVASLMNCPDVDDL